MPDFPIIVGHGLEEYELHLLEYWIEAEGIGSVQKHTSMPDSPPNMARLNVFSRARLQDVRELLDWFVPVLLISGRDADIPKAYLDLGVCAIHKLPASNGPILLPSLNLPALQGACFVISDSQVFRTQLRQVLRFAGRQARMDFSSVEDIAQVLAVIDEWPELILIDVDSERVDIVSLFYRLEKILRDRPHLRAKNQMLICKDFDLPGFDLVKLRPLLAPHAKRIFHPAEALLAIIESMLSFPGPPAQDMFQPARNMQEILYGDDRGNPGRTFPFAYFKKSWGAIRRIAPFQELVSVLSAREGSGLAIKS